MRIKNLKDYILKSKIVIEDGEGGKYEDFEQVGRTIEANIYPATGKLQAEIYGQRLNYILNMLYAGTEPIKEGDGVCVYETDKVDYRVISIKNYSHKLIELEKIM